MQTTVFLNFCTIVTKDMKSNFFLRNNSQQEIKCLHFVKKDSYIVNKNEQRFSIFVQPFLRNAGE